MKLLSDPCIWIADSAATTHTTSDENGAIPIDGGNGKNAGNSITMGNGTVESVAKVMNIPGVICEKNGNEVNPATLSEVSICKGANFNLFSVSKMLQDG